MLEAVSTTIYRSLIFHCARAFLPDYSLCAGELAFVELGMLTVPSSTAAHTRRYTIFLKRGKTSCATTPNTPDHKQARTIFNTQDGMEAVSITDSLRKVGLWPGEDPPRKKVWLGSARWISKIKYISLWSGSPKELLDLAQWIGFVRRQR